LDAPIQSVNKFNTARNNNKSSQKIVLGQTPIEPLLLWDIMISVCFRNKLLW
jgi:hypothetical protein